MRSSSLAVGTLALSLAAVACSHPKPPPKPPPFMWPSTDCVMNDAGVADGTIDPTNPCMSCQVAVTRSAYSPRANGTEACDAGAICMMGACTVGCFIDGGFHDAGSDDPATVCQTCQPSVTTSAWTAIPDRGTVCDAGMICSLGVCTKMCFIDDAGYGPNTNDPADACNVCNPLVSTSQWQVESDGTSCNPGQVCSQGLCTPGCFIGGLRDPDTADPLNPCQECLPSQNTQDWSPIADGTSCGPGQYCVVASCQTGCEIDGGFVPGGTAEPGQVCNACQPLVSSTDWSPLSTGTACGSGEICSGGSCLAGCGIDGGFFTPSEVNPDDPCQECEPGTSPTAWTDIDEGQLCDAGMFCYQGSCLAGCEIDGGFVGVGVAVPGDSCLRCDPSLNPTAFSQLADGTSCGTGDVCSAGVCAAGCFFADAGFFASGAAKPGSPCEVCDPALSTSTWTAVRNGLGCGAGLICSSGVCLGGCDIDGGIYDGGIALAGDPCEVCVPATSTTAWTPEANGTSCGSGVICSSGACLAACDIDGGIVDAGGLQPGNACMACVPATSTTAWSLLADGTSCSACDQCVSGICGPTGLLNDNSFGLTFSSGTPLPDAVVIDGGLAYVTDSYGGALLRSQLDGGGAELVASTFVTPGGLALSPGGDVAYVADFARQFDAVDIATGGVTRFAAGLAASDVATDATSVYCAFAGDVGAGTPGGVFSLSPDGGNLAVYGDGGGPVAIAVDGTGVYWIDDANYAVLSAPLGGGPSTVLAPTNGYANGIAIDGANVYWTTADGGVYQALKTGSSPFLLNPLGDDPDPVGIASDGTNVYFADYDFGAGGGGYLRRVAVGGGPVSTLSTIGSPNHVAVDNQCVYWTTFGGESLQKADK